MLADLRPRRRRARARRDLPLRHRRGRLGPGPAAHPVPRRGVGRAGPARRRLPRHRAGRGRGPRLPALARPVGRLPPGRAGAVGPRRAPHRLRPGAGRAVRHADPRRVAEGAAGRTAVVDPRAAAPASGCGWRASARSPGSRRPTTAWPTSARRSTTGWPVGPGLLADRQVDAADAARFAEPELVRGAWFRDDVTRMDDQQHALSGLLARGRPDRRAPAVRAFLLLLVAVNPPAVAAGLQGPGRAPSWRWPPSLARGRGGRPWPAPAPASSTPSTSARRRSGWPPAPSSAPAPSGGSWPAGPRRRPSRGAAPTRAWLALPPAPAHPQLVAVSISLGADDGVARRGLWAAGGAGPHLAGDRARPRPARVLWSAAARIVGAFGVVLALDLVVDGVKSV